MSGKQPVFDAIKESSAYLNRDSRPMPSMRSSYVVAGCATVFVTAIGAATALNAYFWKTPFPLIITLACAFVLYLVISPIIKFRAATLQSLPAIVIGKHTTGSGQAITNWITLEFENGDRAAYKIGYHKETELLGAGDAGVAFVRSDVLLAFDRVETAMP